MPTTYFKNCKNYNTCRGVVESPPMSDFLTDLCELCQRKKTLADSIINMANIFTTFVQKKTF